MAMMLAVNAAPPPPRPVLKGEKCLPLIWRSDKSIITFMNSTILLDMEVFNCGVVNAYHNRFSEENVQNFMSNLLICLHPVNACTIVQDYIHIDYIATCAWKICNNAPPILPQCRTEMDVASPISSCTYFVGCLLTLERSGQEGVFTDVKNGRIINIYFEKHVVYVYGVKLNEESDLHMYECFLRNNKWCILGKPIIPTNTLGKEVTYKAVAVWRECDQSKMVEEVTLKIAKWNSTSCLCESKNQDTHFTGVKCVGKLVGYAEEPLIASVAGLTAHVMIMKKNLWIDGCCIMSKNDRKRNCTLILEKFTAPMDLFGYKVDYVANIAWIGDKPRHINYATQGMEDELEFQRICDSHCWFNLTSNKNKIEGWYGYGEIKAIGKDFCIAVYKDRHDLCLFVLINIKQMYIDETISTRSKVHLITLCKRSVHFYAKPIPNSIIMHDGKIIKFVATASWIGFRPYNFSVPVGNVRLIDALEERKEEYGIPPMEIVDTVEFGSIEGFEEDKGIFLSTNGIRYMFYPSQFYIYGVPMKEYIFCNTSFKGYVVSYTLTNYNGQLVIKYVYVGSKEPMDPAIAMRRLRIYDPISEDHEHILKFVKSHLDKQQKEEEEEINQGVNEDRDPFRLVRRVVDKVETGIVFSVDTNNAHFKSKQNEQYIFSSAHFYLYGICMENYPLQDVIYIGSEVKYCTYDEPYKKVIKDVYIGSKKQMTPTYTIRLLNKYFTCHSNKENILSCLTRKINERQREEKEKEKLERSIRNWQPKTEKVDKMEFGFIESITKDNGVLVSKYGKRYAFCAAQFNLCGALLGDVSLCDMIPQWVKVKYTLTRGESKSNVIKYVYIGSDNHMQPIEPYSFLRGYFACHSNKTNLIKDFLKQQGVDYEERSKAEEEAEAAARETEDTPKTEEEMEEKHETEMIYTVEEGTLIGFEGGNGILETKCGEKYTFSADHLYIFGIHMENYQLCDVLAVGSEVKYNLVHYGCNFIMLKHVYVESQKPLIPTRAIDRLRGYLARFIDGECILETIKDNIVRQENAKRTSLTIVRN